MILKIFIWVENVYIMNSCEIWKLDVLFDTINLSVRMFQSYVSKFNLKF
jgi:hypothetical protein